MSDVDDEQDKRDRSPKFPYINLTVALQRCEQINATARSNAVRLVDIASDWGVSPTSSSTLRIAAALLAYGLISDEGSGDARRIRLTPEAQRILSDSRPGVREKLLADAATKSPIILEYYQKWGRNRPSDGHAISSLKYDSRFTERAARTFLNVFDDLLSYIPTHAEGEHQVDLATAAEPIAPQNTAQSDALETPPQSHVSEKREVGKREYEWLRLRVARDVTARILVDGDMNSKMIERLMAVLGAQKGVMDDDF